MTDNETGGAIVFPGGAIVCLRPGAESLTADEQNTITEFMQYLRERKAITTQYEGDERAARLAELNAAYEAAHSAEAGGDAS